MKRVIIKEIESDKVILSIESMTSINESVIQDHPLITTDKGVNYIVGLQAGQVMLIEDDDA